MEMTEPILDGMLLLLVKAFFLLLSSLLCHRLLFRATATFRHALLASSLVALLLLPLFSDLLPQWRPALVERSLSEVPAGMAAAEGAVRVAERRTAASGQDPVVVENRESQLAIHWGLLLWGLGVCFLMVRLLLGDQLMRRRAGRCRPLEGPASLQARQMARELGVLESLRFLLDEEISMPLVWGIRRPVVLLPLACREWKKEKFRMILLHELAHVRRRDLFFQKLALLLRALYWFLPPVWLATRALGRESEKACDELVLSRGVEPRNYARELVRAAAGMGKPVLPESTFGLLTGSHLETRVKAVLTANRGGRNLKPRWGLSAAVSLAFLLPLAVLVPQVTAVVKASSAVEAGLAQERQESGSRDGSASWSEGQGRYRLHMKGVRIAPDYRAIESITPGGYFRFWEEGVPEERRLEVEPGSSGELVTRYWVAGEERPAGGEVFLDEALTRLQDLDENRRVLRSDLRELGHRLRDDLDLDLSELRMNLKDLRLESLSDSLKSIRLPRLEPLRLEIKDLRLLKDEALRLKDLHLDEIRDAMQDLSLNLNLELEPHLSQVRSGLRNIRSRLNDVREGLEERRQAFADGLVSALLDRLEAYRDRFSDEEWRTLELQITVETERLMRRSGIHVEEGGWELQSTSSQERRFTDSLREFLGNYLSPDDNPSEVAQQLLKTAREFRMSFE